MRSIEEIKNSDRVNNFQPFTLGEGEAYTFYYSFFADRKHTVAAILGCDEHGADGKHFEHLSFHIIGREGIIPTWEQMCEMKNLVFQDEEECYQVFPKKSQYFHGIGNMKNVMHIWRDKEV